MNYTKAIFNCKDKHFLPETKCYKTLIKKPIRRISPERMHRRYWSPEPPCLWLSINQNGLICVICSGVLPVKSLSTRLLLFFQSRPKLTLCSLYSGMKTSIRFLYVASITFTIMDFVWILIHWTSPMGLARFKDGTGDWWWTELALLPSVHHLCISTAY